jgi:osmotically-inducible protein OsmY
MAMPTTPWAGPHGDEEIAQDVISELTWDARVNPNEIGVHVRNGVVVLTGEVDTYVKRQAAEDAALTVRGVKAIANDIEVRLGRSATRKDADIAAAASRALEWDAALPRDQVNVSVSQGWVTLTGQIEWHHQKAEVEHIVHRLIGVRGVSNSISVRPRVSAADVKQQIERALARAAKTASETITVDVHGSHVTLEGSVHSLAEAQEAVRVAWLAPGVTSVDDRLALE